MGLADRVGDLHLAALGQPGGDHVLGDPAHRVGGRAVDLGRVLAGEGAAAVAGVAAVGVDDDLAAGQAGVAHRAADLEPAGRVDQQPVARSTSRPRPSTSGWMTCSRTSGVSSDSREMSGACWLDTTTVCRRTGVQPVVLDGDLGLAVRAQVGNRAVLAHGRQAPGQPVRERDRQRHQLGRLAAREAEHHALVAGALRVERVAVQPVARSRARRRRPARCRATARRSAMFTPQDAPSKPFFDES